MSQLRRLVLMRHGETTGESSIRFHGSTDVSLSDEGRAQVRDAARGLKGEFFDLVVASALRRSWQAASIVAGGAPVRIEYRFNEIGFGRWEGLTREEIEASDPVLYAEWDGKVEGFEYPGGEARADFRARVEQGLEGLQTGGATSVLVVAHKGTVRTIAESLLGAPLEDGEPPLAGSLGLFCAADDDWRLGRRGSNPG
ncbi:MAG: histidine phosphatase family protein [Myxococcota bacterium]|jgi:broad specificity phosphatase PhoE|nr:alpha-ribazole phosphatase [Deltaproteobacteria bacterium]MCP4242444.1 histidine phosphatase family protein [bacterium]MDP6075759.1 histidine phosphatase family protein [Myxococcota bacterium]MBT40606.1 alpha-ribazole phosphatase [Deltaproteobacteria bacterium]MDP6242614.1 histidine phosphatase family protein [Myxococcota bacterium]